VATECSWNDGSKTQYYYVILDRLPGRSGGLERALEWRVRGPLTVAVSSTVKRNTKVGNVPREREKKRRKKQHMQLSHKKHNRRRGD